MSSTKKKIVLPLLAAIALALLLWLAFHDRSNAATLAMTTGRLIATT